MTNINLNELSLDNVGQWPSTVKAVMILFFSCMVIGLGYWLIAKANYDNYDSLVIQEGTLKKDFELKQRQAAGLHAYRAQMVQMEARFGKMLSQLPTSNEMPGLLEDISKTGIASGLAFELFAPLPEVKHDFYIELPIKIIVDGNYHQLAVFLSRVAQMSRIVTLHDFVISAVAGKDKEKDKDNKDKKMMTGEQLTMEITAKIYRYNT